MPISPCKRQVCCFFPLPCPTHPPFSSSFFVILTAAFGHNECPDPGIPINARRFGDSFQLGSSISVVCEDGFIKTQGSETVSCQLERGKVMWSGPIPKCEGKHRLMAAEGKKISSSRRAAAASSSERENAGEAEPVDLNFREVIDWNVTRPPMTSQHFVFFLFFFSVQPHLLKFLHFFPLKQTFP